MILVVGANGFLGQRVGHALLASGYSCLKASHQEKTELHIDLRLPMNLPDLPDGITHAVILSSVTSFDECFQNPEQTSAFNVTHTIQLIDQLVGQGITPVFISTDAVFDGAKGNYSETDVAEPETIYGKQKRAVEKHLEDNVPERLIIRFGKLYSLAEDDASPVRSLVEKLTTGDPVLAATDQFLAPTLAEEAAAGIVELIHREAVGTFHISPPADGIFSRYAMACEIASVTGANSALISPCSIADFDFHEPRPSDCTLNGSKFERLFGIQLTPFSQVAPGLAGP